MQLMLLGGLMEAVRGALGGDSRGDSDKDDEDTIPAMALNAVEQSEARYT